VTDAAIVVLNWNGAQDTIECLASLRASTIPLHLIVVDNGSSDQSATLIRASGLVDEVIETGANYGYAGGNNIGIRWALKSGYRVIGVLNNDTVADPEMAERLIEALGEQRAVSADIRYHDRPTESWFLGGVMSRGYARHLSAADQRPGPTDLVTGCCVFTSREVWELVGDFDENLFLVFEDFDWSLRAATMGVELATVEGAILLHKVSRSFRSSVAAGRLGAFYFARNGLKLVWRWRRRDTIHFLINHVVRQALRSVKRRDSIGVFLIIGAVSFAAAQRGRAPRLVERVARHQRQC
jgi:GT2 family glycosyltransferase